MQSFDEFLTFMHYLHSPLWESVLRMLNVLCLVIAMLYTCSTTRKKFKCFIVVQIVYFFVIVYYTFIYEYFILRINPEFFYGIILETINFTLPIILVYKVFKGEKQQKNIN